MSDYLGNLIVRVFNQANVLRPRPLSRFESSSGKREWHVEQPGFAEFERRVEKTTPEKIMPEVADLSKFPVEAPLEINRSPSVSPSLPPEDTFPRSTTGMPIANGTDSPMNTHELALHPPRHFSVEKTETEEDVVQSHRSRILPTLTGDSLAGSTQPTTTMIPARQAQPNQGSVTEVTAVSPPSQQIQRKETQITSTTQSAANVRKANDLSATNDASIREPARHPPKRHDQRRVVKSPSVATPAHTTAPTMLTRENLKQNQTPTPTEAPAIPSVTTVQDVVARLVRAAGIPERQQTERYDMATPIISSVTSSPVDKEANGASLSSGLKDDSQPLMQTVSTRPSVINPESPSSFLFPMTPVEAPLSLENKPAEQVLSVRSRTRATTDRQPISIAPQAASRSATASARPSPELNVQVSIGHVVVRATPPSPPPPPRKRAQVKGMSLDEYLNQRVQGGNR